MKRLTGFIILAIILINVSCSHLFEYSPYDTNVNANNINVAEINTISATSVTQDTLAFAVISDPHENYDDLTAAINSINKHRNLKFVVCCGDVTNADLAKEYNWYYTTIKKSKFPLITVIGNHDYLSNGHTAYKQLFGSPNISFVYGNYKFVLFDDIVWENNNQSPDFEWLLSELTDSSHYNILLTHIPPWTDQLEGANCLRFTQVVTPENTILCLHGHEHEYKQTNFNGIPSFVVGCIKDRGYLIVKLKGNTAIAERMFF